MQKVVYLSLLIVLLFSGCTFFENDKSGIKNNSTKISQSGSISLDYNENTSRYVDKNVDSSGKVLDSLNNKRNNSSTSVNKEDNTYSNSNASILAKFKKLDLNNLDNLKIISNLNCDGICNDKSCYLECKKLQKKAQNKLSNLLSTLHSTYPDKCIMDAKHYYLKQLSISKGSKDFLPDEIRSLPEKEIINELAKKCLLVYGITYNDCSLIKKFKFAYPECVELLTLKKRILFLKQWSNKSFSDYLKENNLLLQNNK